MLDIMEQKLLQMREIAGKVKEGNLTKAEIEALNSKLNNLAAQVKALDGESRRIEDGKILEWASIAKKELLMLILLHGVLDEYIYV